MVRGSKILVTPMHVTQMVIQSSIVSVLGPLPTYMTRKVQPLARNFMHNLKNWVGKAHLWRPSESHLKTSMLSLMNFLSYL